MKRKRKYGERGIDTPAEYEQAKNLVLSNQNPTAMHLQQQMHIGYRKAVRLLDKLEINNIVYTDTKTGRRKMK